MAGGSGARPQDDQSQMGQRQQMKRARAEDQALEDFVEHSDEEGAADDWREAMRSITRYDPSR